jgi:hypothetical protein
MDGQVSNFSSTVAVFKSKQRPKRLKIFGDNFQTYEYVVKGAIHSGKCRPYPPSLNIIRLVQMPSMHLTADRIVPHVLCARGLNHDRE